MSLYYRNGAVTPEFADLMLKLAEYLGVRVDESIYRGHAKLLGDIPFDQLRVACTRTAQRHKYRTFPTAADIRSYIETRVEDAALIAWAALDQAARSAGAWSSVVVEDPAAAEALVLVFGDWPRFCAYEEGPALAQRRQEFLAAYRVAQARPRTTAPVTLAGLCGVPKGEIAGSVVTARVLLTGDVVTERGQKALPANND